MRNFILFIRLLGAIAKDIYEVTYCSLLGHDWGEQELASCRRCGLFK